MAATVRRSSSPIMTPASRAATHIAAGITAPEEAKNSLSPNGRVSYICAYCPRAQATKAPVTAPKSAAAPASTPILTASQRRRVTDWVNARRWVPCSSSRASSGAPQNMPTTSGSSRPYHAASFILM